jgi:hypothetical protein
MLFLATRAVIQNEPGAREKMNQVIEDTKIANRKIVQATALRPDDQMIELGIFRNALPVLMLL